jgi:hypothetical protein
MLWQLRCDLIAASGACSIKHKKEIVVEATPLKLPSGQMTFIGAQFDLLRVCNAVDVCRSLFDTWTYSHEGNSLRLAPEEARRYAYRASDPSPEGSRTELGASALAGLGMLAFQLPEAQPHWRMIAYDGDRQEGVISWPIWHAAGGSGASFHTIIAMLRALSFSSRQDASIQSLVYMIAIARRYVLDRRQGDYGNITRAEFSFPRANS